MWPISLCEKASRILGLITCLKEENILFGTMWILLIHKFNLTLVLRISANEFRSTNSGSKYSGQIRKKIGPLTSENSNQNEKHLAQRQYCILSERVPGPCWGFLESRNGSSLYPGSAILLINFFPTVWYFYPAQQVFQVVSGYVSVSKIFLLENMGIGPNGPEASGKFKPPFPPLSPSQAIPQKPCKEELEMWL